MVFFPNFGKVRVRVQGLEAYLNPTSVGAVWGQAAVALSVVWSGKAVRRSKGVGAIEIASDLHRVSVTAVRGGGAPLEPGGRRWRRGCSSGDEEDGKKDAHLMDLGSGNGSEHRSQGRVGSKEEEDKTGKIDLIWVLHFISKSKNTSDSCL
jgi:hypothetical protein